MKVAVFVQDSLPNRYVGPDLTPNLWRLITNGGGWCQSGGISVLASSTFPNHATFVTGGDVQDHGIYTNKNWNGSEFICASSVGPAIETLFDAAAKQGLTTAAVMGDQTMIGVTAAHRADVFWPSESHAQPPNRTDSLGYAANQVVIEQLIALDAPKADLCLIHINEPDSALHVWGPEATEVHDQIKRCDDDLGVVVELFKTAWQDTVFFVLSDHEQELVDQSQPEITIQSLLDAACLQGHGHDEGAVAQVVDGPGASRLLQIPEIEGAVDLDDKHSLVWSTSGRVFGHQRKGRCGQHGSPRTVTQVAAVAGGHPVVGKIASTLNSRQPHATEWAPTIAKCLGFELPSATGRALW